MLGFFESKPFTDSRLGTFERRRGQWVGAAALTSHERVELRVAGDRKAPDAESLRLAADAPAQYASARAAIARELFEHYEPYHDAWRRDELEMLGDEFPELSEPDEVWAHVSVERIDVDARRLASPIEVRLRVVWDEEHTLGVLLRDAELVELNGSMAP